MANGLLSDWMSGTGVYGSPNAIDPSTGVPYADVRSAQLGALGNIGSLLIAAGQPMTGAQRAQLLGQIGPQLSSMQTDIYNAAQRRLMQSQFQDQMAARASRTALAEEAKADPLAFEKKYGFNPTGLSAESLSSLAQKVAETNAFARPEREARAAAVRAMRNAGIVSQDQALIAGGGPTVEAGAMIGKPTGVSRYDQLMAAGDAAADLGTPAGDKTAQYYYDLAQNFKPVREKLGQGEQILVDGKVVAQGPPKPQELSTSQKDYRQAVEQGYTGSIVDFQLMMAKANQPTQESQEMKERVQVFGRNAEAIQKQSAKSAVLSNNLDIMEQINKAGVSGGLPGAIAKLYPPGTKGAEVFESLVGETAPQLRQEGSGSQSDADLGWAIKAMPQLLNKPGGNQIIIDVMRAKANINKERADIISKWVAEEISMKDAAKKLAEIDNRTILTDKLKNQINQYIGVEETAIEGGTLTKTDTGYNWTPGGM